MASQDSPSPDRPDVNIVVCTDEYGCARWYHQGRNANAVLDELRDVVAGLDHDRVQVTTAGCILGCTYGPRFDVARRWSGRERSSTVPSPVRPQSRGGSGVQFSAIPARLRPGGLRSSARERRHTSGPEGRSPSGEPGPAPPDFSSTAAAASERPASAWTK